MLPARHNFLHFDYSFLVVEAQTFINENMSLRRFNFYDDFFWQLLEGKRWQSSTKLGSIGTLISFKTSKTFDLRSLSARLAGIPEISIYSLQEHCLLA